MSPMSNWWTTSAICYCGLYESNRCIRFAVTTVVPQPKSFKCCQRQNSESDLPGGKFIAISATSRCFGLACIRKAYAEAGHMSLAIAFLDYCRHGKRAYAIAAEIEAGQDRPSSELLMQLSNEFEMCAYGLREIRREWEENESDGGLLLS